jgi:hypothetical protein
MIRFLTLIFLTLLITACGLLPAPTATPTCQIVPMPTGEGVWQLDVREAPPAQVLPGEDIRIRIYGGVVVGAQERRCGEQAELLQPNLNTAQATRREVWVLLDQAEIARTECGFECEVLFTIPSDTVRGRHTLAVAATYGFISEFSLEVLPGD